MMVRLSAMRYNEQKEVTEGWLVLTHPRPACTLRKAGAFYAKLCRESAARLWKVMM